MADIVHYTGHSNFTQRLVLSTLTGKPIAISQIRSSSPTNPGLAPHEVSFLRLLESITNGSTMQISMTGTRITYHPGLIAGAAEGMGADGDTIHHTISAQNTRGVTYFLYPLCLLAPFSKAHMNVRFSGPGVITSATHHTGDMSVDTFRTAVLPLFSLFGIPSVRIELRVLQRSCAGKGGRGGGGVVEVRFGSQVRLPKTLHLNRSPGRVKRIRGVAYSTGASASNNNRMIFKAREILNPFVSDIHIAAQYDVAPLVAADGSNSSKGEKKRTGVGFGMSLVAETNTGLGGVLYAADVVAPPEGGVVAEDLGQQCAYQLLEEISRGGCVSGLGAPLVMTLMAMGTEDVGRVRLGREVLASEPMVALARDLKLIGASTWGVRGLDSNSDDAARDEATDLIVSVKGTGVGNVARKLA